MRLSILAASAVLLFPSMSRTPVASTTVERIATNDNRASAGTLRDGVLTVHLEVREGDWHPDRETDAGLVVRAFAEKGKRLLVPGPLIRVPEGTEIHAFVSNTISQGTLVVHGLSTRGAAANSAGDTIQIAPGATRDVRFVAGAPGTYYYWASIGSVAQNERPGSDEELDGAFIVDPRGAPSKPRDRVFVISLWSKDPTPGGLIASAGLLTRFTINGKSWPNTERLTYAVGDSIRFRIVNTSSAVHPMHLHGFYFDVNSRGNGSVDSVFGRTASPRRVVTERTASGRTFSMTWVPERPGNWLFHCHDNFHVLRNAPLDGTPLPAEHLQHVTNHARDMMGGLVMGIEVRGAAPSAVTLAATPRRLRLVARTDTGSTENAPAYGYMLQDGASTSAPLLPGPTILLKRGQPVSITIVNELREATAVHWHGIELESYFDGVAGFSGRGTRITPAIAPGDSFVARFTPPRAGTFMYHPHADEVRQQQAGLSGVLVVLDDPMAWDAAHDKVLLLTVPRLEADRGKTLLNGSLAPPPLDLRVGERYRLRVVDVHTFRPSMIVRLLRDSTLVTWRALAKDGMTLPADQATVRPSTQQMGNGETYDFELAPTEPGDLRITVSAANGVVLATMPVRVR